MGLYMTIMTTNIILNDIIFIVVKASTVSCQQKQKHRLLGSMLVNGLFFNYWLTFQFWMSYLYFEWTSK